MAFTKNDSAENTIGMQHPDYKNEIIEIIRSNMTPKLIKEHLQGYHENDISSAMEELTKEERHRLYSFLDMDMLAEVLEYSDNRKEYLDELGIRKRVEILSRFEINVTVDYLRELEKSQRNMLIELMDDSDRKEIALSSSFDEDEIGSRMDTNYVSIPGGISIRDAMKCLIEQAAEHDNISTIYVVDENHLLLGAIDLKDLIIARENTSLDAITTTSYPYVYTHELTETCLDRIKDYCEDSIPVLDENNRLRGVLTAQDITEIVKNAFGDDYAKLAGLATEEDLQEPLLKSIHKRLPWLVVLLGLGLVVSSVVGLFEHVVAHLTLIVCFQSLILDMAGNVGTQSLAVTIRVLVDEQIDGKQKLAFIAKEARVGLLNGIILGLLSFVAIGIYLILLKGQPPVSAFAISACIGLSLLAAMLLASIVGTVIPILFKKMKVDPAVASGPLITTINDLVAVVSYYGLAWFLLIRVLQL